MQQYLDLMEKIRTEGEVRGDRTGVGTTSLFGEQIRFDLADGFPLLTTKTVFFRGVVVELLWFLRGRTDNQWLNDRGVTIWNEWATADATAKFGRNEGDLGPIYGKQWRDFGGDEGFHEDGNNGVDQIARLLNDLHENPLSRRHIVSAWNPKEADQVALPPCHTLFQCYVHMDGRIDLHLYARSIDTFLGLPFNIASYALLLHLICHKVRTAKFPMGSGGVKKHVPVKPGRLIISFGDVHLYQNHTVQVETQLVREPGPLPTLKIEAPHDLPLDQFEEGNIVLSDYHPQGKISAPVAV